MNLEIRLRSGATPFVHLDVAGTAWVDKPAKSFASHDGTGVGVRLFVQFLKEYAQWCLSPSPGTRRLPGRRLNSPF